MTMNMSAGVQGDHLNTLNLQHKLELTELRVKLPSFSGHPNRVVSLRYPHYTRDIHNTARQKALPHSAINASLSGSSAKEILPFVRPIP